VSVGIIWHTLNKNDIKRRTISQGARKCMLLREDYFENIDCEGKAYWLGFLMADGYTRIGNKNDKTVNLALQVGDSSRIEAFKLAIGTNKKTEVNHYKYRHDLARLSINSSKMYDDLVKHGCIPRKSLKTVFPDIKIDWYNHFVRGYFDGDGWITKPGTFGVVGGEQFLLQLRDVLTQSIGVNLVKLTFDKRTKAVFSIRYGGRKQLFKIYNWLYENANTYLLRKRQTFEEILAI
jgi:hypothetical protein